MKNRKLKFGMVLTAALCLLTSALAWEVSTNAVKILPERNLRHADAWEAETVVAQGDIMKCYQNFYMARVGGTLGTNAPIFRVGAETNGTAVLQYVERGPRRGFVVQLCDSGTIWLNVYNPAVPNAGLALIGRNAHWSESGNGCPQGSIWAVGETGTTGVTALEW